MDYINDIKQSPMIGLTGTTGGVGGLAFRSVATKTYVNDVFSTYLYTGTASARSINNRRMGRW